jgi:hypothetical protein
VGVENKNKKHKSELVFALYFGSFGMLRNDYIFNRAKSNSFMQVIPLATHWIRMWFYLQPTDKREKMDTRCNRLESIVRDLYTNPVSILILD